MAQRTNNGYLECWFSRLLARKGEDYISSGKLTDDEVVRNVDRIINDIINGKIDYDLYGAYMLYPVVFDNLLSYCRNRYSMTSTEMYCLGYVNWAIETGQIQVANMDNFPNGKGQNNMPYNSMMQPYDMNLWNAGVGTISMATRSTIPTAIRDISFENNKYRYLTQILENVQSTKNIFELAWATNGLKQYTRSNNKNFRF